MGLSDIGYALPKPGSSTLAPWAGTQKLAVRREAVRLALELKGRLIYAESEDAKDLLRKNKADALLLQHGKILVSEEVKKDNLKLLRRIIHEEIEALMQIIERNEYDVYADMRDIVLSEHGLKEAYYALLPDKKKPLMPWNLILNDIVARAFEIILLERQGLISKRELTDDEGRFLDIIRPIIERNKVNYFTGRFWDSGIRETEIRIALANGQTFIQVASAEKKPPRNSPAFIFKVIYDQFREGKHTLKEIRDVVGTGVGAVEECIHILAAAGLVKKEGRMDAAIVEATLRDVKEVVIGDIYTALLPFRPNAKRKEVAKVVWDVIVSHGPKVEKYFRSIIERKTQRPKKAIPAEFFKIIYKHFREGEHTQEEIRAFIGVGEGEAINNIGRLVASGLVEKKGTGIGARINAVLRHVDQKIIDKIEQKLFTLRSKPRLEEVQEVVKRIIVSHGGTVEVKPKRGAGLQYIIHMPDESDRVKHTGIVTKPDKKRVTPRTQKFLKRRRETARLKLRQLVEITGINQVTINLAENMKRIIEPEIVEIIHEGIDKLEREGLKSRREHGFLSIEELAEAVKLDPAFLKGLEEGEEFAGLSVWKRLHKKLDKLPGMKLQKYRESARLDQGELVAVMKKKRHELSGLEIGTWAMTQDRGEPFYKKIDEIRGDRLKWRREAARLGIRKVAKEADLSMTMLKKFEAGEITGKADSLKRLHKAIDRIQGAHLWERREAARLSRYDLVPLSGIVRSQIL